MNPSPFNIAEYRSFLTQTKENQTQTFINRIGDMIYSVFVKIAKRAIEDNNNTFTISLCDFVCPDDEVDYLKIINSLPIQQQQELDTRVDFKTILDTLYNRVSKENPETNIHIELFHAKSNCNWEHRQYIRVQFVDKSPVIR
jgi:hypothetical protein